MAPDLIVYALVAIGLILWLRSLLGTRHGGERERPNPFAPRENLEPVRDRPHLEGERHPLSQQEKIEKLTANPGKILSVDNKTAERGLLEIAKADKNFDIKFFLEAAQEAFIMIVEAFARGDRETLKDLLGAPVYESFEHAIAERDMREETMSAEILAMRKTQVTQAELRGRMAYVTVLFQADEINVTKDKSGAVVAGHPERIVPMRDLWTFGRDIKARDPRWLVYQTRGDLEDDNDIIPNTV